MTSEQDSSFIGDVGRFYSGNTDLWTSIGSHFKTPETYLHEFQLRYPEVSIRFELKRRGLNFANNKARPVHRWTDYLEGFSDSFVYDTMDDFGLGKDSVILDPFTGSGTVNVCSMMRGIESVGIEINPTIFRVLKAKTAWEISPEEIRNTMKSLDFTKETSIDPPVFMKTDRQFRPDVLQIILRIKEQVQQIERPDLRIYFELAFMTVLLPCSNLKRSPSIGYDKKKETAVHVRLPVELFETKVGQIIEDIEQVQRIQGELPPCHIYNEDSMEFAIPAEHTVDAVITSPPYLNSFDYVGNYKLEIGWMEDAQSTADFRELRDRMILCDNVSRKMIQEYEEQPDLFDLDWVTYVTRATRPRMRERLGIRRKDYHILIRKYFEDIYRVLCRIHDSMRPGGKVAWVVGDSLILDVYIPTDLITMMVAEKAGFRPMGIEIDRVRRSGIRRSFVLRESIVYFTR
ncbi:MAG: hypothetical protein JSW61_11455 [Candidatus Thorarchaeota archaeon]|nr:MAG: hypothetical protein JSW61_11455 [Candidatus Thorarchaeota archaeon]